MTLSIVPIISPRALAAVEQAEIHLAACRYRRQGLVCSTCADLIERAERLAQAELLAIKLEEVA